MKKISVVIPVYNSEKIVGTTAKNVVSFFENQNLDYEIILINDHSPDGSWKIVKELAQKYPHIIAINLLKNYGQHNAIFCGFCHATGDYVVTMDDDMQNPPEEIIHLLNKAKEGHDVVFGKFRKKKHSLKRRLGTKIIGYLNFKIFNKPKNITLTNFRLIRRDVIERVINYQTAFPYIPGLVLMFSHNVGNVMVEHRAREIGKSNYSLFKISKLVGALLFNYSSYPIKLFTAAGFVVSLVSFLLGLRFLIFGLIFGSSVPGWTTVVVLVSFLGGFIILMLGMIGEYLARVLNQVTSNKGFIVKEIINNDD
ncbi:glycosyltransferase family 2 protein [Candidatus Peregrinibacteria bacterium]|jgi:polyisoprenyl-phosphate glycosyltransferase|nr:glycosyltransferase family 2 protein [Candidatus Peregrinibacteria bacterium]MBT7703660.1 glycosyltransferase family 2 protein [Candidatus Peregrinibacteria bacterium]